MCVMIAEPFTCRQITPCWRASIQEYTQDVLNIFRDRTGAKLQVTVMSGGIYKVIAETSQTGSPKGDWPNGLCERTN
jgi:hypothetical protein